ncbi:MAG TPA: mechanosensitive ion channel family protein, partial [Spirochaetia bacterium]|nr:mechanosensitive ion channel family protein [Spirochaetia bacterium]
MNALLHGFDISKILTPTVLMAALRVVLIVVIGLVFIRVLAITVRRLFAHSLTEQARLVLTKVIMYTGVTIVVVVALNNLGVQLSALLGAAGVVGVAVGIASQTSLGNIISGLFLVSE